MLVQEIESARTMPLMDLPLRTSVFALDGARVLLGPASTLTPAQLGALGPVDVVVAPNLLHVEGCTRAAEVFPDAKLWGPDGVREKALLGEKVILSQVKDRDAFRASVARVLARDFDRIAPSHGALVGAGAKEKLRAALAERGCTVARIAD